MVWLIVSKLRTSKLLFTTEMSFRFYCGPRNWLSINCLDYQSNSGQAGHAESFGSRKLDHMSSLCTVSNHMECGKCRLFTIACRPADPNARDWRHNASVSSLVEKTSLQCMNKRDLQDPIAQKSTLQLADMLCYGCLVPFLERQMTSKAVEPTLELILPEHVEQSIEQRLQMQAKLKKEVADFLL